MASTRAHPAELRERAVKMVFELRAETGNTRGSLARVGKRLGVNPETLRNWVQKRRSIPGSGPVPRPRIRSASLSWNGNRELRRANEILKAASAYFARELDPRYPR